MTEQCYRCGDQPRFTFTWRYIEGRKEEGIKPFCPKCRTSGREEESVEFRFDSAQSPPFNPLLIPLPTAEGGQAQPKHTPLLIALGLGLAVSLVLGLIFSQTSRAEAPPTPIQFNNLCGRDINKFPVVSIHNLERVLDGDTQDVFLDLWADRIFLKARLRLLGVDTPEKYGSTKKEGLKATEFSTNWWKENTGKISLILTGFGKYGRPLVYVINEKKESLNAALIQSGNAKYYCGGKRT